MSNGIPLMKIYVITYPKLIYVSKRGPMHESTWDPVSVSYHPLLRTRHIKVYHFIYPYTVCWKFQNSKVHLYLFSMYGNSIDYKRCTKSLLSFLHVLCNDIYLIKSLVAGLCVPIHDLSTQIIHYFSSWIRTMQVKGNCLTRRVLYEVWVFVKCIKVWNYTSYVDGRIYGMVLLFRLEHVMGTSIL